MRLLICGGNGQLATEYKMTNPLDGWEYIFLSKEELDITNKYSIDTAFSVYSPDAVLNLAAYTNVERAEKKDMELAYNVNAVGPKNLASKCSIMNIPIIHISTDYVFDGKKESSYTEKDLENPINHYGRTKFVGEKFIEEVTDKFFILRVSWLYSNHASNFFNTMLKLGQERNELNIINDQYGSPTSTKEVCKAIDKIIQNLDKKQYGIYHFSGLGRASWKDFADEIFNQVHLNININGISSDKWESAVERPKNSYLSSSKFSDIFEYKILHWKTALKDVILERKQIPIKVGDNVKVEDIDCIVVSTDWLKREARIANKDNLSSSIELPFEKITL